MLTPLGWMVVGVLALGAGLGGGWLAAHYPRPTVIAVVVSGCLLGLAVLRRAR